MIAAPNWAEVRYIVERKIGLSEWLRVQARLLGLPLNIVPADQELSEVAGELKVVKKMSLADCFAAALAKRKKGGIYTGDRELKTLEQNQSRLVIGTSCGSNEYAMTTLVDPDPDWHP